MCRKMLENDDTFGYATKSKKMCATTSTSANTCETKTTFSQKFTEQILNKFNFIKYSTYRTAVKLVELKKLLYTQHIPFQTVKGILAQHKLNQNDNVPNINRERLTTITHDIFFAADKMGLFTGCTSFALDSSTSALVNFLIAVFNSDGGGGGFVSSLDIRQTMLLLCQSMPTEQTFHEHFTLCADHNCLVTRYRFEAMLKVLAKLFAYLDYSPNYAARNVMDVVAECFEQCPGIVGFNEYQFNALWQQCDVTTLFGHYSNAILLMKRMCDAAQSTIHDVECVGCGKLSFEGLRFQCQQCSKVSLCFNCFCTGYATKKHEPTHRMYEISSNEVVRSKFMSFLIKLCNLFTKAASNGPQRPSNSVVHETQQLAECDESIGDCNRDTSVSKDSLAWLGKSPSPKKLLYQSDINEITAIVKMLNEEKEIIAKLIEERDTAAKDDALRSHETVLNTVIKQLCTILVSNSKLLEKSSTAQLAYSSTPLRQPVPFELMNAGHGTLTTSIAGADMHKSYLDSNGSDLSLSNVSTWLHTKKLQSSDRNKKRELLPTVAEHTSTIQTEMSKFKELLNVVKDIIEGMDSDSDSDNVEISKATSKLENVLENIIRNEENRNQTKPPITE